MPQMPTSYSVICAQGMGGESESVGIRQGRPFLSPEKGL